MKINRSEFSSWLGPCVYLFWKDGRCLYVGMSLLGIRRPMERNHIVARECIEQCTDFEFLPCATQHEALNLESRLIREHQPIYNDQHAKLRQHTLPKVNKAKLKRQRLDFAINSWLLNRKRD